MRDIQLLQRIEGVFFDADSRELVGAEVEQPQVTEPLVLDQIGDVSVADITAFQYQSLQVTASGLRLE